jgi:hypothetical protein
MDELRGPADIEPADGSRFILMTRCNAPDHAKRRLAAFARIIASSEIQVRQHSVARSFP